MEKKQEDNVVIKNIFNTKIVHNIIIMIKNVLRQSSNEDQNSKDHIGKNTSTKSPNSIESVVYPIKLQNYFWLPIKFPILQFRIVIMNKNI